MPVGCKAPVTILQQKYGKCQNIISSGTKNLPGTGPLRELREVVVLDHSPHRLVPTEGISNDTFLTTSDEVLTAIAQRSVFTVRVTSIRDSREKS